MENRLTFEKTNIAFGKKSEDRDGDEEEISYLINNWLYKCIKANRDIPIKPNNSEL